MKKRLNTEGNLHNSSDVSKHQTERIPLLPIFWIKVTPDGTAIATLALERLLEQNYEPN